MKEKGWNALHPPNTQIDKMGMRMMTQAWSNVQIENRTHLTKLARFCGKMEEAMEPLDALLGYFLAYEEVKYAATRDQKASSLIL